MLPKDLLDYLEKGDRTIEDLKAPSLSTTLPPEEMTSARRQWESYGQSIVMPNLTSLGMGLNNYLVQGQSGDPLVSQMIGNLQGRQ